MRRLLPILLVLLSPFLVAAQERSGVFDFAPVQKLIQDRCSACHDWAADPQAIVARVTPGKPEESLIWQRVSAAEMPPDGPLPDAEQKLLLAWIEAGAPTAEAAPSGAAAQAAPPATGRFLGFRSKVAFHQTSGFTSGALFTAAGVLGAIQWGTLISEAHAYRDAHGISEETMSPQCYDYIMGLWDLPRHQAIRWTHVGLLSTGEALYLANAVTGIGMITRNRPGLTASDLHRYAFFTHGTLMLSQLILGMLTTTLLSQGNHWTMIGVGAAHTAIGFAIPAIMIGAGLAVNAGFPGR